MVPYPLEITDLNLTNAIEKITMNTTQTTTTRRHSLYNSITTSVSKINPVDENLKEEETPMLPWEMDDEDVAPIPDIYPQMICPLRITDTTDVGLIGRRLWDFLIANSVHSVYDKQRGRVFCSSTNTSFVVQFWRSRGRQQQRANDGNDEENTKQKQQRGGGHDEEEVDEEIILEIRRRSGCGYGMHKIRNSLKKSIESKANREGRIVRCEELLSSQQRHYRPSSKIKMMASVIRNNQRGTIRRRRSSAPPGDFL